jgi:hypothetical protein
LGRRRWRRRRWRRPPTTSCVKTCFTDIYIYIYIRRRRHRRRRRVRAGGGGGGGGCGGHRPLSGVRTCFTARGPRGLPSARAAARLQASKYALCARGRARVRVRVSARAPVCVLVCVCVRRCVCASASASCHAHASVSSHTRPCARSQGGTGRGPAPVPRRIRVIRLGAGRRMFRSLKPGRPPVPGGTCVLDTCNPSWRGYRPLSGVG